MNKREKGVAHSLLGHMENEKRSTLYRERESERARERESERARAWERVRVRENQERGREGERERERERARARARAGLPRSRSHTHALVEEVWCGEHLGSDGVFTHLLGGSQLGCSHGVLRCSRGVHAVFAHGWLVGDSVCVPRLCKNYGMRHDGKELAHAEGIPASRSMRHIASE